MLSAYNPTDPLYFGCRFKPYVKQGYMSGGAGEIYLNFIPTTKTNYSFILGYVLSRTALKKFVLDSIPNKEKCRQDNDGAEDVEIGTVLFPLNLSKLLMYIFVFRKVFGESRRESC
jgi:glycoprotein-N-acetylgalactosamine 3-beta-galactosyltransferase